MEGPTQCCKDTESLLPSNSWVLLAQSEAEAECIRDAWNSHCKVLCSATGRGLWWMGRQVFRLSHCRCKTNHICISLGSMSVHFADFIPVYVIVIGNQFHRSLKTWITWLTLPHIHLCLQASSTQQLLHLPAVPTISPWELVRDRIWSVHLAAPTWFIFCTDFYQAVNFFNVADLMNGPSFLLPFFPLI